MSIAEKLLTIAENEQKIYDAGKQAEWNDFWDNFQSKGNRTAYSYAFHGKGFGNEIFYPKYNITCVGETAQLFCTFGTNNEESLDLKARLEECGVTLDVSRATTIHQMFASTNFTVIPSVDFTGASSSAQPYQANIFNGSRKLVKIEGITINENNLFLNWFTNCNLLEDVRIIGTIGQNGFDIHYSTKLSKASLLSILEACNADVTASPVTITLPIRCIDGATDTEALLSETGDAELYTAQMKARNLGYSIAFN